MLRLAARFMGTNNRACLVRLQKAHAPMAMVILLTGTIKIPLLYTSGPTALANGRVRFQEHLFRMQKGKKASSIKRNEIVNLFNQTKLQIYFQKTKVPTLVHRLQINVHQTHSTNYPLSGRTISSILLARVFAKGVTVASMSSSSEGS